MGIAIIPKDKKAMKQFVGKTREWIKGFLDGNDRARGIINDKIKDLKERKKDVHPTSVWAMKLSIEELGEINALLKVRIR